MAILLLTTLAPYTHASDDANSNNLTPTINTAHPTSATTTLVNALNNLTLPANDNGLNQTQLNNLTQKLTSQLKSGNNTGAQRTLTQLQNYIQSSNSTGTSPLLRDTINSMTVNSNGLSIDTNQLQNLIGQPDNNGMPTGLEGTDPSETARGLSILSSALNSVNPLAASNLLSYALQLQNSLGSGLLGNDPGGSNGLTVPTIPPITVPDVTPRPGGQVGQPSLPTIQPINPGAPSIGDFGMPILVILLVAVTAIAGFFLLRRSNSDGFASLGIFGVIRRKPAVKLDSGPSLTGSPRDMIVHYFRMVVGAMRGRGVLKLDPDTHREFSDKCAPRPEAPPVKNISVLYEKAVFSGREVLMPEAENAKDYLTQVENTPVEDEKDGEESSVPRRRFKLFG